MKIGDIKIGTTYAATDGKRRSYSGDLPRRVEALEIITEPVSYWSGGGYSNERGTKNVRKVKVRCLDEPRYRDSYRHERVMTAPEGTEITLEARFLAAPWSDVRAEVKAKISEDQAKANAKAVTLGRIHALLPKRLRDDHFYVEANKYHGRAVETEARLGARVLEEILRLAEIGKAAEDVD